MVPNGTWRDDTSNATLRLIRATVGDIRAINLHGNCGTVCCRCVRPDRITRYLITRIGDSSRQIGR